MDISSSRGLYKCIVRDCCSIQGDRPVFRLPKDMNKFEKWLQNVNRLDLLKKGSLFCYHNRRICNLHFEDKMFTDSFKNKLKRNAMPIVLPLKVEENSSECSNTRNIGNSSNIEISDLSLSTDDTRCQTRSLTTNTPSKTKLPDVCFKSKLKTNVMPIVLQPSRAAENSEISEKLVKTSIGKCSNNVGNSSTMKISDLSTDDTGCQTPSSLPSNTPRTIKFLRVCFKSKLKTNAMPIVLQHSKVGESSKITEEMVKTSIGKCSNNVGNSSTMEISDSSISRDDPNCQTPSSLSLNNTPRKRKLPDVCFKSKSKRKAMPIILQPSKAAESSKISKDLVETSNDKCSNNVGNSSTMEISDSSIPRDDPNCQTPLFSLNTSQKRKLPQKLDKTSKQQTSLVNKPEQSESKTISTQQFLNYCTQHFSPVFVEIIKAQHGLFGISANGMRYSTEFKQFALELYFLSPLAYEFLSQSINLPSKSTLMEMAKKWKIEVGHSDET